MIKSADLLSILFYFFSAMQAFSQSYVPEESNKKFLVKPAINMGAYGFPLSAVRLLESPFKRAMEKDAEWLLMIDPDRLLNRFYLNAGLEPKAPIYGGWESETISGHSLGHYLSACSMMYASTGDSRFLNKVKYIVDELAVCQEKRGTGYVGGIPGEDTIFVKVSRGEISTKGFDLNGGWVPWYTIHKIMAGLVDAFLYCDNQNALLVAKKMADWAYNILKDLNEDQIQVMLACEHGGMNEVLANLYAITTDKKYLDLSYRFHHKAILDPLANHIDQLSGKHANTQIPKIIGCARRYELTADPRDSSISRFFWRTVVRNHTYVIGGNSFNEYLGDPGKLNNRLGSSTCETCNTYNMLKLTRHLFCQDPNAEYADFYERALYNHILASQNHQNGMVCYYVPLGQASRKEFSTMDDSFWCCVGTGFENHAKYGESIYYSAAGGDGGIYINLFIPSVLTWTERGMQLEMNTQFPYNGKVRISLKTDKPQKLTLHIRHPYWALNNIDVRINGILSAIDSKPSSFISINRTWKNGDVVELNLPMDLHLVTMPDNQDRAAILYGPLVLAGILGNKTPDPLTGIPGFVTDNKTPTEWISIEPGAEMKFKTKGAGRLSDVDLIPFFEVGNEYYNIYWDFYTNEKWDQHKLDIEK